MKTKQITINLILFTVLISISCSKTSVKEIPDTVQELYNKIKNDTILDTFDGITIRPRGSYYLVSIDSLDKYYMVENSIIIQDFDTVSVNKEKNIHTELSKYNQELVNKKLKNIFAFISKNKIISINGRDLNKNIEFKCCENYVLVYNKNNITEKSITSFKLFYTSFKIIDNKWAFYEDKIDK